MQVFISLLRGVNVGGHNKIAMDALRDLYRQSGLHQPRTYIQSGNVVFGANPSSLTAKALEDAIAGKFAFRPGVVLRTTEELRRAIAANPFAKRAGIDPAKLWVAFLADSPGKAAPAALRKVPAGPEEVRVVGREVFVYFPDGMGRSKFPWATLDKILKTTVTGRNLRTVTKLLEMAEALEAGLG
jgi:uncharacterized protein (DUF1697 family)